MEENSHSKSSHQRAVPKTEFEKERFERKILRKEGSSHKDFGLKSFREQGCPRESLREENPQSKGTH